MDTHVYTIRHQLYSCDMTEAEVVAAFTHRYGEPPTEPPFLFGEWHVGPVSDEQYQQLLRRRQEGAPA